MRLPQNSKIQHEIELHSNIANLFVPSKLESFQRNLHVLSFFLISVNRWLNPLLSQGSKKPLEAEDLYGLRTQDSTGELGDKLQK